MIPKFFIKSKVKWNIKGFQVIEILKDTFILDT